MNLRSFAVATLVVASTVSALAGEFFFKPGCAWDQQSGYYLDSGYQSPAAGLPGVGDTVNLEEGANYEISSADAVWEGIFQKLSIVVTHPDTVLRIMVPEDDSVTIGPHVRGSSTVPAFTRSRVSGCIEKWGAGELKFGDTTTVLDTGYYSPFYCNLDVREGVASLPKAEVSDLRMGRLVVRNGAKCNLAYSDNQATRSLFAQITVEPFGWLNNPTARISGHPAGVSPVGNESPESVIDGYVSGYCYWWSSGDLTFNSTTNSNSKTSYLFEGTATKVKSLGHCNRPDGSLGRAHQVRVGRAVNGRDTRLEYTGDGEEVAHALDFGGYAYLQTSTGKVTAGSSVIDAGKGGLYFRKGDSACKWSLVNDWTCSGGPAVRRIELAGDGSLENRVETGFDSLTDSGVVYPAYIRKTGKGIWTFLDPVDGDREHVGTTQVEDGTLRFASLAPKGEMCALGRSSRCTVDSTTALDPACYPGGSGLVDYAFALGSLRLSGADPVFEYCGTSRAVCSDRPLVLVGEGGTISSPNGELDFSGVSARDSGSAPTLKLGGSGFYGVIRNVSDGAEGATVSVEKIGSGTWTMAGENSFSGSLAVKSGCLKLKMPKGRTPTGAAYSWYRFSIAQIGGGGGNRLYMREIALYDKDGVRQNQGLKFLAGDEAVAGREHEVYVAPSLAPGEAGYDASAAGKRFMNASNANGGDFNVCFQGSFGSPTENRIDGYWYNSNETACAPNPADRSTWIPIVMHLADGSNPVTHFDIQGYSNGGSRTLWPTRIMLEGSVDGTNWDVVFDNATSGAAFDYSAVGGTGWGATDNNLWLSDGAPAQNGSTAARPLETAAWKALFTKAGENADLLTWYRFSIAKIGNGAKTVQARQLCFFDAAGNRLNDGLEFVETPTPGTERTILGTQLTAPGQIGYDRRSAGKKISVPAPDGNEYGELDACTMTSSGWNGEKGRWNFTLDKAPSPSDPGSWLAIVFRLKTSDAAACRVPRYFDIQKFERQSNSATPTRFRVEGSPDGENWMTLYDNTADASDPGVIVGTYNSFLSDGTEGSNNGVHHPAGNGFALSGDGFWQAEAFGGVTLSEDASISVSPGAEICATASLTVHALTLDASGNGVFRNLVFGETGTLTVPDVADQVYTPTFVGCSGLENLSNWTGRVVGRRRSVSISYDPSNGSIRVRVSKVGTMLIVR